MADTLRTIVRGRSGLEARIVHVTEEYRPGSFVTTLCGVRLDRPLGMHVIPDGLERCDTCGRALLASPNR